jgi:hypothetical protein
MDIGPNFDNKKVRELAQPFPWQALVERHLKITNKVARARHDRCFSSTFWAPFSVSQWQEQKRDEPVVPVVSAADQHDFEDEDTPVGKEAVLRRQSTLQQDESKLAAEGVGSPSSRQSLPSDVNENELEHEGDEEDETEDERRTQLSPSSESPNNEEYLKTGDAFPQIIGSAGSPEDYLSEKRWTKTSEALKIGREKTECEWFTCSVIK